MRSRAAKLPAPNRSRLLAATAVLVLLAGAVWTLTAQAQPVYRIVGADGKVTFSDKPPPAAGNSRVTTADTGTGGAPASVGLPFELRQVANKYPVTLYTGSNCSPCASARNLLVTRGIPFSEKTVASNEDIDALQRLSGDVTLPFATIGGQRLQGFSDVEWTQFLNAAGYPATSALPASYRAPAATPLVAATVAAPPATGGAAGTPRTEAPRPAIQPNTNPAGIQF